MSRSGVEAKLPWSRVPKNVRQEVELALGAPVKRAARIWGGYGPAPTFRLALSDGRRAFLKATYGESNEFSIHALYADERAYRELGSLVGLWMAQYIATIHYQDWHGLLLEDLGAKSVPPWRPPLARSISYALAEFHLATFGRELPDWIERPSQSLASVSWSRVREMTDDFRLLAAQAGDGYQDALLWLQTASPAIEEHMAEPRLTEQPWSLLHGDLRSDNLRFHHGRLWLFDWPAISVGRAEWDVVAFAQTVTVEGGLAPEQVMAWYGEKFPVNEAVVEGAIAWWLCYFADKAWRSEIPGLPRVRRFQRQQLAVLAQWAARKFMLPEPSWTAQFLK